MTLDIGINFRATSGFVTDAAGETYSLGDAYPTTRGGVTFGWVPSNSNTRDRAAGNDRRLAGINFFSNTSTPTTFKLDLPASGSYTIHLALGDAASLQGDQKCRITDGVGGATLLTVDVPGGTVAQHFDDASAVDRTNVTWPTNEVGVPVTFTGTQLVMLLGANNGRSTSSSLTHLRVVQAGAALVSHLLAASGVGK